MYNKQFFTPLQSTVFFNKKGRLHPLVPAADLQRQQYLIAIQSQYISYQQNARAILGVYQPEVFTMNMGLAQQGLYKKDNRPLFSLHTCSPEKSWLLRNLFIGDRKHLEKIPQSKEK